MLDAGQFHPMNPASEARLTRARQVAVAYTGHPGLAAVLVVGSVARGWADRWSDLELLICWNAMPDEATLAGLASRAGAGSRRVFADDPASEAIDEEWRLGGLKVDSLHRTVGDIERSIREVVEAHATVWATQARVAAIRDGITLHGEALVGTWRDRTAYPDGLARAMVQAHLTFGPHAWLEMLAERGDALSLYTLCCEVERRLIGVLLGLNQVYPPAGDTKWAMRVAGELAIAPPDAGRRLEVVFRSAPRESVRELGRLVDETVGLVEWHMPEVDTRAVRTRVAERRSVWTGPCPGE